MKYKFYEVTDLRMSVTFSLGNDLGEFREGARVRELFVIYEGASMRTDRAEFFKQLKDWIDLSLNDDLV